MIHVTFKYIAFIDLSAVTTTNFCPALMVYLTVNVFTTLNYYCYCSVLLPIVFGTCSAESGSEGTSDGSDANSQSVSSMPLN
jgi:hypothetical protein